MKSRDQYVAKLKERLDLWNARAAKWEEATSAAKSKQLAEYRAQRDKALYNLKLLENASVDAWADIAKGTDEAWDLMQGAFDKARVHFEKSGTAARN
jgi:hypothetical protein